MATCDPTPLETFDLINQQVPIIRLQNINYLWENGPYTNSITGGFSDNRAGNTVRTAIPGRAVTNQDMVEPVFADSIETCGTQGQTAEFGQVNYESPMQLLRGKGPLICMRNARGTVVSSYESALTTLRMSIKEMFEADIRANYVRNSGLKASVQSSGTLGDMINGGETQVAVDFPAVGLPTSPLSHQFATVLYQHVVDNLPNEQWGSGAGSYAILASSTETLNAMRREAGVKQDILAITQGSFTEGKDILKKWVFTEYPYLGLKTMRDPKPYRFATLDANGYPVRIQPYTRSAGTTGFINLTNQAWVDAPYEIAFLLFKNSFRRDVPRVFRGEGTMQFPAQSLMGDLRWIIPQDLHCSAWQDFGQHLYEIERAYIPIMPWTAIPILHKRCVVNLGNSSCEGLSE